MIKVSNIPDWKEYPSRVWKKGTLYVTPQIEMDLMSDPDFDKFKSVPKYGAHFLKGWLVHRYIGGYMGPDNAGDPDGILRTLAWNKNFRNPKAPDRWDFSVVESNPKRVFWNKVIATKTSLDEHTNYAVLSAEFDVDFLNADNIDSHFLGQWIKELPEIK